MELYSEKRCEAFGECKEELKLLLTLLEEKLAKAKSEEEWINTYMVNSARDFIKLHDEIRAVEREIRMMKNKIEMAK